MTAADAPDPAAARDDDADVRGRPGPGPGDTLPPLELETQAGEPFPVRTRARRTRVLVAGHGAGCEACRRYAERLAEAAAEFGRWDGEAIVVAGPGGGGEPGAPRAAGGAAVEGSSRPALRDPEGAARRRLDVPEDRVALLVADRFGEVFLREEADEADALPEPDAVLEWLRYLATQCPECGVPDTAGHGAWEA